MTTRWGVALFVALAIAGCGGGDSAGDSAGDGKALSKDEYISKGDALCQDFLDKTNGLPNPTTQQETVETLDQAIGWADEALRALEDLKPPADGRAVHDALVTALRDSTAKGREARDAAANGDQAATAAALEEASRIGQSSDQAAKDYGFKVCGSESELRNP